MNGTDKRDHAVEQLLRQSLKPSPDDVTDVCLDAETIAAWMDGGLTGAPLDAAQMHAADCDRCQALLATFAQLNAPAPTPASEPRRWFAWLVPLTAAAAIAIWALLPRSPQPFDPARSGTMARNEAKEAPPPEVGLDRAPEPMAAAPAAPGQSNLQAPERRQERFEVGSLQDRANSVAAPAVAAAPDTAAPAMQWRLSGPRVEQSTNGGSAWATVYTGQTDLTAMASPAATVCWVVGRGGVVLRAIDGRSFARVPFPETVDLTAVRAVDASTASVTTADGRTLTTTDAGATWRPSLQEF